MHCAVSNGSMKRVSERPAVGAVALLIVGLVGDVALTNQQIANEPLSTAASACQLLGAFGLATSALSRRIRPRARPRTRDVSFNAQPILEAASTSARLAARSQSAGKSCLSLTCSRAGGRARTCRYALFLGVLSAGFMGGRGGPLAGVNG